MNELNSLREKIDNARHFAVKSSDPSVISSKRDSTPPDADLNDAILQVFERQQESIDELKKLIAEQKR